MAGESIENMHLRADAQRAGLQVPSPPPAAREAIRAENEDLKGAIQQKQLANTLDDQIATTHHVLLPFSERIGGALGRGFAGIVQRTSDAAAQRAVARGRTGPVAVIRVGGYLMSIGLVGLVLFLSVLMVLLLLMQMMFRIFASRY